MNKRSFQLLVFTATFAAACGGRALRLPGPDGGASPATTTGGAGVAGTSGAYASSAGEAGSSSGAAGFASGAAGFASGAAGFASGAAGGVASGGVGGSMAPPPPGSGFAGAGGAAGASQPDGTGAGGAAVVPPPAGSPACAQSTWMFFASTTCAMSVCATENIPPSQVDPAGAIDGDPFTRYSTGIVQSGGEYVVVTFAETVSIDGVHLSTSSPMDGPVSYDVSYATDGTTFVDFTLPAAGPGSDDLFITFPRTSLKAIKITQTGAEPAGVPNWWSIHELTVEDCQ